MLGDGGNVVLGEEDGSVDGGTGGRTEVGRTGSCGSAGEKGSGDDRRRGAF